jgi:hypothetical protein
VLFIGTQFSNLYTSVDNRRLKVTCLVCVCVSCLLTRRRCWTHSDSRSDLL